MTGKNAKEKFHILKYVIGRKLTKSNREEICSELGVSESTLYRQLEKLKEMPVASSMEAGQRGPKVGKTRLTELQETLIEDVIRDKYLKKQKPRAAKTYLHLVGSCEQAGVKVPSKSSFVRRLRRITKRDLRTGRMYASERYSKHSPKTAHFTSHTPMSLVQIDHTKLNALIISRLDGEVLGRVIFTVITDIHTRIVLGFYIGLYGPDHESVSHALAHACFDKTQYLSDLGLKGEWPNLGLPEVLHMDNAKEFKSKAIKHGCGEYGIERQYRPVAVPHYGGHVESLVKTLNENLRNIPGATFADIKEKGDYPSEKLACFTLPKIEKYIANFIVNYYHKKQHSKLGISPIQKYQDAIERGFTPRRPPKPKGNFIADFSESHIRSVRDLGLEFECKEYWNPYLASLYNQNITEVRVMPIAETVKAINVLGPDGELHRVPAKDLSLPDVTRREWKRYRKIVLQRNKAAKMSNSEIAQYISQEDDIEREARQESLRLRRARESQISHKEIRTTSHILPAPPKDGDIISFDPTALFKIQKKETNNVQSK